MNNETPNKIRKKEKIKIIGISRNIWAFIGIDGYWVLGIGF